MQSKPKSKQAQLPLDVDSPEQHPLAPLLTAVMGLVPFAEDITDAHPAEDNVTVLWAQGLTREDMMRIKDHPFLRRTYSTPDDRFVSEFEIPIALPVILYRMLQAVEQQAGRDKWEDVLAHLQREDVYPTEAEGDEVFIPPAQQAALVVAAASAIRSMFEHAELVGMAQQGAQNVTETVKPPPSGGGQLSQAAFGLGYSA